MSRVRFLTGPGPTGAMCGACHAVAKAPFERCPLCKRWGTCLDELGVTEGDAISLAKIKSEKVERLKTGVRVLDQFLGGGFVRGGVYLLSGDPGAGKSTWTLSLAAKVSGEDVGIVCAEESPGAIKERANRMQLGTVGHIYAHETCDVEASLETAPGRTYGLRIIDSLDMLTDDAVNGVAGSAHQKLACLHKIHRHAKETGEVVIAVSHVNKDGDIAGSTALVHLVTAPVHMEYDPITDLRTLVFNGKNRGGATSSMLDGVRVPKFVRYEMTETGLELVKE